MKRILAIAFVLLSLALLAQDPPINVTRNRTANIGDSLFLTKITGDVGRIQVPGNDGIIMFGAPTSGDTLSFGMIPLTSSLGIPGYGYVSEYKDATGKVIYINATADAGGILGTSANFSIGSILKYVSINGIDSVQVLYFPEVGWIETGKSGTNSWTHNKTPSTWNITLQDTTTYPVSYFEVAKETGIKAKVTRDFYSEREPFSAMINQSGEMLELSVFNGTAEANRLTLNDGRIYNSLKINNQLRLDSNVINGGMNSFDITQDLATNTDTLTNYQRGILQTITVSGGGQSSYVVNEAMNITADGANIIEAIGWELNIDTSQGGTVGGAFGFKPGSMGIHGDSSALIFAELGDLTANIANKNYWVLIHDTNAHALVPSKLHVGNHGAMSHGNIAIDLRSDNEALLLNRWDTVHRNNLSTTAGMIGYNSTQNRLDFYDGSAWVSAVKVQSPVLEGQLSLTGDARYINHIDVGGHQLGKGTSAPTSVVIGNFSAVEYGINDDSHVDFVVPEKYEDGTDMKVTIYWVCNENFATNSGEVKWNFTYTIANEGGSISGAGTTITSGDLNIPATAYNLAVDSMTTRIDGTTMTTESVVGFQIKRVALDAGSNPTAEPAILEIHVEYMANKLGRNERF